jgi:CDP-glycerol glycerophosphotransferase
VLVTDYSSVFFDFANTGRKIVLYAYDKDEYFQDRGVYVPLEDMPFPIAEDADALIQELRSPKQYDDADFRQTFDPYDGPQASKLLLEQFLLGKNNLKTESIPNNGKHNVLLYGGNLAKNGLTSSLVALLNTIDLSKRNYIVAFPAAKAAKHKEVILTLPEGVSYMPIMGKTNATLSQKIASRQFRKNRRSAKAMEPVYDDMYHDDLKRLFGDAQFTDYVHFTGYDYKRIQLFARAAGNRVIFVHNNMVEEIKTRNSQHGKTLEYAYNTYDKVAIVSEDMKEPTKEYCHEESRMTLVNNTIDHKSIRKRGKKPIVFDEDTLSTHTLEELQVILDNDEKKFITVGRFSPEKGHDQLMKAFDKTFAQHPNTWLVIIGGHGPLYEDTLALRDTLSSKEHIIIIQSMKNPQPVIRQCDYFFLSSHHEGLGLVLLEADIQGLPVVSTDILGPRGFVNAHGGTLVEDSVSGLAKGMEMSLAGQVSAMNVDYDAYNKQAAAEFESVLEPVS